MKHSLLKSKNLKKKFKAQVSFGCCQPATDAIRDGIDGIGSGMRKLKGQVSFEFILVLAVVLLLSFAIMSDFFEESTDSFVLAAARQTAEHAALERSINDAGCNGARMTSFAYDNGTMALSFSKCAVTASFIADAVERDQCGATPNGDSSINCGTKTYSVVVS